MQYRKLPLYADFNGLFLGIHKKSSFAVGTQTQRVSPPPLSPPPLTRVKLLGIGHSNWKVNMGI